MQSFVVFYWSSIRLNLKCCVLKLDFGWFRDKSAFYEIMQIQGVHSLSSCVAIPLLSILRYQVHCVVCTRKRGGVVIVIVDLLRSSNGVIKAMS